MHAIRHQFEKLTAISDEDWQVFAAGLQRINFPKKGIILRQGQVEQHLSFIEQGLVRLYIPGKENDVTFGFVFENQFVSAYDSFLTQTPSSYQVECLKPTVLWQISHSRLNLVYTNTSIGNLIGRKSAEAQFLIKARRELSLLNETPEERYLNLFSERPEVIRSIPLKYIASYIGITPQALSRIRRRIS